MGKIKDFKNFMPIFCAIIIFMIFISGHIEYKHDVQNNIDSYNEAKNNYSNAIEENKNIELEIDKYDKLAKKYNALLNEYKSYKNSYPSDIDQKIEDLKNSIN